MPRMAVAFLVTIVASWACDAHAAGHGAARMTLEIDLVQVERGFLERFEDGFVYFDEIETFFFKQFIDHNNKDRNVYARPKVTFADGQPVEISKGPLSDARRRKITKDRAWLCASSITFELTPRILPDKTMSLAFKDSADGRERLRITRAIAHGKTVLVSLKCSSEGTHTVAMVTPRIAG